MAPSTEKYSFAADVSLSSDSVMYNLYLKDSLMQTAKRAALMMRKYSIYRSVRGIGVNVSRGLAMTGCKQSHSNLLF